MSELDVLREHLSKKKLKRTQQRETILAIFLQAKKHLTVEELHSLIRYQDPSIGLTTVYRSMKLFCECGLARANHFEEGLIRYEQQFETPHHDHMVCLNCGETVEFVNSKIEQLQEKIARDHGFEMTDHRMDLFGYCPKCKKKEGFKEELL